MSESTHFVGLDVHAKTVSIAVAAVVGPAEYVRTVQHDRVAILKALDRIGPRDSLYCAYEAGPTGYGLVRALREAGIRCDVAAPSKIPKAAGDHVKTDRRDAQHLAKMLRSGDLPVIGIPDEACEAMRDLMRAREDAKRAQGRARHQLSKFLLRLGHHWPATNWTKKHFEWIYKKKFQHASQASVFEEYSQAVNESTARIARYDALLEELVPSTPQAPLIEALQAFRGIKLLTASSIAFELGDLRRFPSAKKLMGFLGVIPSEDSSGDRVRRGAITRTGNKGLRRLFVESAWSYRYRASESVHLKRRAKRVAPGARKIAWDAQVRLTGRYRKMTAQCKPKQKVLVAMARELAGFVWAVGQEETLIVT